MTVTSKQQEMNERATSLFALAMYQRITDGHIPEVLDKNPDLLGNVFNDIARTHTVYLAACNEYGSDICFLKIGLAVNIRNRMSAITTSNPLPITKTMYFPVGSCGAARRIENDLHERFARYRCRGEWFLFNNPVERVAVTDEILTYVDECLGHPVALIYNQAADNHEDLDAIRKFAAAVWDTVNSAYDLSMGGINRCYAH